MATWSVLVVGIEEGNYLVKVADDEAAFKETTVKKLKKKISESKAGLVNPEYMRLLFAGKQLEDEDASTHEEKTLEDYNIQKRSAITVVMRVHGGSDTSLSKVNRVPLPPASEDKEYPSDFALKFTDDPDCIDPYSDSQKRVKMKCGHAVEPNTLTAYCRSLLDQHIFTFTCPAIVDGKKKQCKKEWDYTDVRLAALFNDAEMQYFESKMSEYAASQYCDLKECPGCRSFVERIDLDNLRVHCPLCTKKKGKNYDFCWHCLKEWTGPMKSSVKCGNESCVHPDLPSIRDAPDFVLNGKNVPNRRACPTCGKVTEHLAQGCKFIVCPRCKKEFCFMCLELKEVCLKSAPASWYGNCGKPVAPKQTIIPCWSRDN
ncbi:PREDICTED: probable E3 ubiquitin-protein ligase ARI8 [Amphimedon queenslandica]|uniref:RBR-type E3 ubiquitin transferase n=1 Tax=Amphimedon queenslandica TaxID=400682 RepID=A0A1X7T437_AMPQE|nr:PREDICTED: probable E3 ubiquitin-protein ligase ARI8 [Amphimedon queenslandica]|eukprot:XP_019861445.1 PREDICTED: probable E3 ubiquitin-protein ligase ARI8 [Amphimedon queenslandica]